MPHVGDKAPSTVRLTITATDLDMTEVTAVDLVTRDAAGFERNWVWEIQPGATASSLLIQHTLDALGLELERAGTYLVFGDVVFPGGRRKIEAVSLEVFPYPPGRCDS